MIYHTYILPHPPPTNQTHPALSNKLSTPSFHRKRNAKQQQTKNQLHSWGDLTKRSIQNTS